MASAAAQADAGLPGRLVGLLDVSAGSRVPEMERLRRSPVRAPEPQMVRSLDRASELLDLFAPLMATKLLAWAERESNKQRQRDMPRLAWASVTLAKAARVLLAAGDRPLTATELWAEIERVASRDKVASAIEAVEEHGHAKRRQLARSGLGDFCAMRMPGRPVRPLSWCGHRKSCVERTPCHPVRAGGRMADRADDASAVVRHGGGPDESRMPAQQGDGPECLRSGKRSGPGTSTTCGSRTAPVRR
jgi:hypothetical protein